MKIAIVDYGAGNLPSVERALLKLDVETQRAVEPRQLESADAIVLPGVGHFAAFVAGLRERNLTAPLRAAFAAGKPMLGICLGLQAMFAASDEAPGVATNESTERRWKAGIFEDYPRRLTGEIAPSERWSVRALGLRIHAAEARQHQRVNPICPRRRR